MASTRERPRLRFDPIPIETTFEKYRKSIPAGEPTPSPSPRSPSPPSRGKRRFAPQLVESSVRRSRRAGDEGPATRPTDKTDITPYTNHLYAPKLKKRPSHAAIPLPVTRQKGHARRESCDDEIASGVFSLVAMDAQKKLQEVAMSAFPNSGQRIGGAEHYYVRESSEDDDLRGRPKVRGPWAHMYSRRNSSEEDLSWAFKEMQDHHHRRSSFGLDRMDTMDLDNMSIEGPPSDAMGLTRTRQSLTGSPFWQSSRPGSASLGPIGESHMPLIRAESPMPTIGESAMPYVQPEPIIRPIGESFMPYIPSAPAGKAAAMPFAPVAPASQIPPETEFRHYSPFVPFPQERDLSLERARNAHRMRVKNSPPMLGQDLTFRMCPSPKQTKLEPAHLWDRENGTMMEDANRDPTGQHGLWRGYCYTQNSQQKLAPVERTPMICTPMPLASPSDPFDRAFASETMAMSEEPTPAGSATRNGTHPVPQAPSAPATLAVPGTLPEHRTRNNMPKGLHMIHNLHGLDERLKHEKEAAELEEKIAAEFDDNFVTQVYNYLSLGYPALARQYDEELSKISRIRVEELEQDDYAIMEHLWDGDEGQNRPNGDGHVSKDDSLRPVRAGQGHKKIEATGHIMLDSEEKDGIREEDRCPRWKALKLYIYEWARQHPDLDGFSPLGWGVRERRGSWGI